MADTFPEITIALADYQPHKRNYNRHPASQIERLRASLRKFGQPRNIVVWRRYFVAGHGVAQAAMAEGWQTLRANEIPADWPETRVMAFLAADNELSRLSDPDQAALAALIDEARQFDGELLAAIGYDDREFAELLKEVGKATATTPSDAPPQVDRADELRKLWQVEPGQLWRIGEHRLICGDCTDAATVAKVMGGEKADMMLTDPEYDADTLWIKHLLPVCDKHWLITCGDKQAAQICRDYCGYFNQFFVLHFRQFSWNLNKYIPLLTHLITVHLRFPNAKNYDLNGMHSLVESASKFDKDQPHNHAKHIDRTTEFVKGFSYANDIVIDCFAGSGTTLVACQNLRRKARAIELSPAYCAVILQRMRDAFPTIEIERIN